MNLINQVEPAQATGKTKQLFDAVKAKLGAMPNMFRVLGTAPAALEGYLNFSGALAGGGFNAKVREQIALAVAESNLCGYCLSARRGRSYGEGHRRSATRYRRNREDGRHPQACTQHRRATRRSQ